MSVMLYGDDRFGSIYKTLNADPHKLSWLFRDEVGSAEFCRALKAENIKASNVRYGENAPEELPDLRQGRQILNRVHFYKVLEGVRYNIDEAGDSPTRKTLDALIESVASNIITALPDYAGGEW